MSTSNVLRLTFLMLAVAGASAMVQGAQAAEPYPTRPIRMIAPLPPGTATDYLARVIGQHLAEKYKHQVVVDNRPGAGGLIGSTLLTKANPDGYTFAIVAPPHLMGPLLRKEPPYHPLKDVSAVAEVAVIANVLMVSPHIPAKSAKELVALAKSKPGQLNFASVGVGTIAHIGAAIFNHAAGIDTVHVPFKTLGDVFAETLAGNVHYFIFTVPSTLPMIKDGRLRALAVTTSKRSIALPDIPTMAEAGFPAGQSDGWFGIVAPAGTPRQIVSKVSRDIAELLRDPQIKERLARQGAEPAVDPTPEKFTKRMQDEYGGFQKLIKAVRLEAQ
ncbi:MAG: tripartite tricarboxylate transporter substrate binding protein [Betaproteobacteria bacterium]|nr:tripartite tricarboxylate transporter substrate binding protein [Betaproteobacteria bacterium]